MDEWFTYLVDDAYTDGLPGAFGEGTLEAVFLTDMICMSSETLDGRVAVCGASCDGYMERRGDMEWVGEGGGDEGKQGEKGMGDHGGRGKEGTRWAPREGRYKAEEEQGATGLWGERRRLSG